MCDTIQQTTEQLMNLVLSCNQKVNIPFEVYRSFSSEYNIEIELIEDHR